MKGRIAVSAVLVLLCGCWGGKFIDMPGRVEDLEAGQARVEADLDSLRASAAANEILLRGIQAQSGSRVGELVSQLTALTEEMETIIRRMGPGSQYSSTVSAGTSGVEEQTAYDEAYLQFQQRNYSTASAGFLAVLQGNPTGPLADDALYYAALCHEGLSQPHLAIEELATLAMMFPDSERAPSALSRAAAIYGAHGAASDRARLLALIVERYPGTEEARLARTALGE